MTSAENALADRIVEYLRSRRAPVAANEIANRLGETVLNVTLVISKLEASGDIVAKAAGVRSRRYYEIARR